MTYIQEKKEMPYTATLNLLLQEQHLTTQYQLSFDEYVLTRNQWSTAADIRYAVHIKFRYQLAVTRTVVGF